jgi:Tol biopolymer transport system component
MTAKAPRAPRRPRAPGPPRAGDPYGIGPVGSLIAPIASVIGLLLIAVITINLFSFQIPFVTGNANPGASGGVNGPPVSAAPSNVVIVPPEAEAAFKGSIVYAKAGNIWVQDADGARQITSSGGDSMPSWSPDGAYVYYIRTRDAETNWRGDHYLLLIPDLMRVPADGSADPERLATGRFKNGNGTWAYWLRQPTPSPDGEKIALITDSPNPEQSNVVLQLYDIGTKKIKSLGLSEIGVLGHQDPEWRPDGKYLLYVKNGRSGSRGSPIIARYDPATKKTKALTAPGYTAPSYSPDGRYIAVTRTNVLGTDVAILDANNGREVLRVTDDGASYSPSWSPAGDGISFLHLVGQIVDLHLAKLDMSSGVPSVTETIPLTEVSGLDAGSRPDWFIPASELPAPPPTPTPTPEPSDSGATPAP